ncbi:hypothetical protein D7Y44_06105 [Stenotrophomonas maltophilia]|uniref:hypothetical protein n=1 Tax=Stenotrophomonas maltophilia TaxID=40324 RepID=UPI0015DD67D5|nr:hypothetical protein [Stenotrophomonas maltophilia]MBA0280870.1 hypothetical protein [Stenotrophomonas maltophilia]MBA0344180.1 hypothetical protein [Stenotrophomonas maltophilia]MBA0357020.1 hypothetical protein [Stenotrophomonas maltophilia]MBA0518897.1 hypothetical protein [Stenotrophomonas maltophilia]
MTNSPYRNYRVGIGVSLLLAALIAALSLIAVATPNLGWGIVALATVAIWVGLPLLLVLLLAWLRYMVRQRGRVPGRVHALMFAPTAAALLIVPVWLSLQRSWDSVAGGSRAPIAETHINLSGQPLWLDTTPYASNGSGAGPDLPMQGDAPERFMAFHRYPNAQSDADHAFPYEDARLKRSVDHYRYGTPSGDRAVTDVPLVRQAYPDTSPFKAGWRRAGMPELVHLYYHYSDHVEVAPTLARLSGLTADELERSRFEGLVLFKIHNYGSAPIVRMEVNGIALDIGDRAIANIPEAPQDCTAYGYPVSPALMSLDLPLQVRWQTLAAPTQWHSARVQVPAFRQPQPLQGQSTLQRVLLYVLPDDALAAERYAEVVEGDTLRGIKATGLPASAAAHAVCGSARASYREGADTVLAD